MDDATFLAAYDPADFPPVAVAVDVVPFALLAGTLHLLLVRRAEPPARGRLALPGTFVRADEDLDTAAVRALRDKAGIAASVRQFHAFGAVARDPRMRIVSIGYMAAVAPDAITSADHARFELLPVAGGVVRGSGGRRASLPFDHGAIITQALADLRRDLDRDAFTFGLLAPLFTLRELQLLHEAVRGEALNKPAFRKRLVESGRLEASGEMETGKGFRPAELYRAARGSDADA